MAAQFLITTTGTQSPVVLDDLGGRALSHPTTSIDFLLEYSPDELLESENLWAAVSAGHLIVRDENDVDIADPFTENPLGMSLTVEKGATAIPYVSTIQIDGAAIVSEIEAGTAKITVTADATSTLAALQIRRTTLMGLSDSWVDVQFTAKDIENDDTVIEWNDSYSNRIDIKEDGHYLITALSGGGWRHEGHTHTHLDDPILFRVRIDDTSNVPAGESVGSVDCIAELTAGSYLTLQAKEVDEETTEHESTILFTVTKLGGVKGEQGDPGTPGGTVEIQKDDSTVVASANTINIEGDATVTDEGSGKATINITGGGGGGSGDILITIGSHDKDYGKGKSSWTSLRKFIFGGTTTLGTPTQAKIIGWSDSSATASFRLFDVTNGNVIAEWSTTSTSPTILIDSALEYLPTGEAIFQIQATTSGVTRKHAYISCLLIQF